LNDPTLSAFLVDYPPGASAVLHRMPSWAVLVHVLGHNPCFCLARRLRHLQGGSDLDRACLCVKLAAENPSAQDSAPTLVVLVTGSQKPENANDTALTK
jgi:hypothetical protein